MESTPCYKKDLFTNIINYRDFYLMKDSIIYKILLGRTSSQILIKSQNYLSLMDAADLSLISGENFNSLDDAYEFMISSFEENRISVKEIKLKEEIILSLVRNKEINIVLTYGKYYNYDNFIFNEIQQLKNEKDDLKNEVEILKKEINDLKNKKIFLKKDTGEKNKKFEKKVTMNIKFVRDITEDTYAVSNIDHSFVIFKSINDLLYIIYSNIAKSLLCYDLEKKRKIKELKNYHNQYISSFRHFLDKANNTDLVMSVSGSDNNIKILNCNTWEEQLDLRNINNSGLLYSACFLNDNNNKEKFILTSNRNKNGRINEPIKIYNFKGKKIDEINYSDESTLLIDTFYDTTKYKTYIITGNIGYVKSYEYPSNRIYYKYNDIECLPHVGHFSVVIYEYNGKIELIESSFDGALRVWDFHSCHLLKKIKVSDKGLRGICLWNENYIFVGCDDNNIKLVEIREGIVENNIEGHINQVITIKKVLNFNGDNYLVTQNKDISSLKLWKIEN